MKKLTKKSLDELAKTMNVIPEDDRDNYWGMYTNDCFWRCVSYLCSGDISEAGAASMAQYYANNYNTGYYDSNLSHNNANATPGTMNSFNSAYGVPKGTIAGFYSDVLSKYYGTPSSPVPQGGHIMVSLGKDSNGNYMMYDPQNNYSFTMSSADFNKNIYLW